MARFSLFGAFKAAIQGVREYFKATVSKSEVSEEKSSEVQHIEQREEEWQSKYNQRLSRLKEKYQPLFENAQMKYEALENSGISDYSSAYQNAGGDFKNSTEISDMATMFREVARAQTFVKDPTSNLEVVKKETESNGINIYVGRGNGSDSMKDFWSAVNRAKETSDIKEKIVAKQYSGAFEYAYKVWKESEEPDDTTVHTALKTFLETETSIREQDYMTPTALKYEMPEDDIIEDEKFDF